MSVPTANPFFMGVDYGTLIKNLRVINELIGHKTNLIRSNTEVIEKMDLELKAANENTWIAPAGPWKPSGNSSRGKKRPKRG